VEDHLWINPMVGVVEGFRWALLGVNTAPGPIIFGLSLDSLLLMVAGAFYFRRMERTFAESYREGPMSMIRIRAENLAKKYH